MTTELDWRGDSDALDISAQELADAPVLEAARRASDGEFYGVTDVDRRQLEQLMADILAAEYFVCPDCGGMGYCGRCNDNGYLDADGQPLPWGHWGTLPRVKEVSDGAE